VLRYVWIARQKIGISARQVFIPLDPPVGQEAEVDWGSSTAILVGYARYNYMVPIPQAKNLEDLNRMILEECQAYGDHRISGKESSVNEMYEQEKHHLLGLPDIKFSNIQTTNGKSDKYSTVIIDKNRYSVPTAYAYLKIRAVLKVDGLDLFHGNKKIAEHPRLYNNNQWSLDPTHYLKLIGHR